MNTRYGAIPNDQFTAYKKRLHSAVHWLLVYADNNNPALKTYFATVQYKLLGLNSLLEYSPRIVEMMVLLESAKLEYEKEDFNKKLYRRTILDIHDLVDRIGDEYEQ